MMWSALGDTLPLAVGLALSPFAIATGIVLLLGQHGRLKTAAFGLGWFAAILAIASVALWVVDAADDADQEVTASGVDLVQLAFALLFFALAALGWSKRPRGDAPPKPGLLARLDGLSVPGALGIGLVQGFVVVKNIPLALGAGAQLGEAGLAGSEATVALLVFALVATLGVVVPLAVATVIGSRMDPALQRTRAWVEANMSALSVAVLVVLGAFFLGQGLAILD